MKRLLLTTILFCLFFTPNIFSQQNSNAIIVFKSMVYDFGTIKEDDGVAAGVFEFTNTGRAPLILQRVISSCNCTSCEWPKQPLAPGESGKLKVKFDPKGRSGAFDLMITTYTNSETAIVVLHIKGVVKEHPKTIEEIYNRLVGEVRFKSVLITFGRMITDEVKTDTLDYINMSNDPVKLDCNLNGLTHLVVKFVPESVKPKERGLIIVTYDAKKRNDWGFLIDRFYLMQNNKQIANGMISVSATIEENFSSLTDEQKLNAPKMELKENEYNFGEVNEGQLVEKEFVFTNTGKSDLIIRKIKASCGCTTVDPSDKVIKPGQTSSFKATVKTNGFSERISKSITIITNDPVTPTSMVRIIGTVEPQKK